MNESPGGSPNPLNPDSNTESEQNKQPIDSILSEPNDSAQTVGDSASQGAESDPLASATAGITDQSADNPLTRPMEKAPATEPVAQPKKKKVGLIVGIVIAVAVCIGAGVAAVFVFMNMNRGDAVAQAIQKIFSGDRPGYIAVDGTMKLTPKTDNTPIKGIEIAIKSDASTKSLINNTVATLTATFQEGEKVTVELDEVYPANGDLYFKVDGIAEAIEEYQKLNAITVSDTDGDAEVEDTVVSEDVLIDSIGAFSEVIEYVDGQWLRISTEELNQLSGEMMKNSSLSCVIKFADGISESNNSIAGVYSKYPFVKSTTEGVTLSSKGSGPVYKVTFDEDALRGFISSAQESDLVKEYTSCMEIADEKVDTSQFVESLSKLPDLFVEVDRDNNFTRLYSNFDSESGKANVETDIALSYPNNINVAEPTEYKNFTELMQEIVTNMYQVQGQGTAIEEE